MLKLTENNIINTLKNYSENPSDGCWESIANNLTSVTPPNNETSQVTQSGFNHFVNSLLGKAILAVTTLATIATIITLSVSNDKLSQTQKVKPEIQKSIGDTNNVKNNMNKPANNVIVNVKTPVNLIDNKQPEKEDKLNSNLVQNVQNIPIKSVESIINNTTKPLSTIVTPEIINDDKTDEPIEDKHETSLLKEVSSTEKINSSTEQLNEDIIKRPNVFTPNGDGYNDNFVFENIESFPKNRLIVINSNGVKVFEQIQYNNSWDGSNAPDGTYFYILEVNNGEKTVSMYGSVQILR